jgi:two-component system, OmpR family, phosphate regulon response regulator OmpR
MLRRGLFLQTLRCLIFHNSRATGIALAIYARPAIAGLERDDAMGTILVVDDDKTCRDSIQRVLEREGHRVETAENADAALQRLRAQHFDLLVCDYRMPGKTGIDLLIELRLENSTVPVLMISAYADASVHEAFERLGGLEVLRKPIRRRDLVSQAARVLGN